MLLTDEEIRECVRILLEAQVQKTDAEWRQRILKEALKLKPLFRPGVFKDGFQLAVEEMVLRLGRQDVSGPQSLTSMTERGHACYPESGPNKGGAFSHLGPVSDVSGE